MRLLHTQTHILHDFPPNNIPPYSILSHTWGESEVTLADLQTLARESYEQRLGWSKIAFACKQALHDGFEYLWADTCCIDKSSSAELSEAINSMFSWYQNASACYAYLVDVQDLSEFNQSTTQLALSESRWFTRGWTLQELLAPSEVMFFSTDWTFIGSRTTLAKNIAAVTGIETSILKGHRPIHSACAAKKMFWISRRETTRPEDMAYCMLGIFDINMPTLYGEGGKAYLRLQEEILRTSDDHSLFAWVDVSAPDTATSGLLAASPSMFRGSSSSVVAFRDWTEETRPFSMSNSGLAITLPIQESAPNSGVYHAFLNCAWSEARTGRMYVQLEQISGRARQYCRTRLWSTLQSKEAVPQKASSIFVRQSPALPRPEDIVHPQLFVIDVQTGPQAFEYAVRAYLHTEEAFPGSVNLERRRTQSSSNSDGWPAPSTNSGESWKAALKRQTAFNQSGEEPAFFIPGVPTRLALVLLMEFTPTMEKFFMLIGSGYNTHFPAVQIRPVDGTNKGVYGNILRHLNPSKLESLQSNFQMTSPRIEPIAEWLHIFKGIYNPRAKQIGRRARLKLGSIHKFDLDYREDTQQDGGRRRLVINLERTADDDARPSFRDIYVE